MVLLLHTLRLMQRGCFMNELWNVCAEIASVEEILRMRENARTMFTLRGEHTCRVCPFVNVWVSCVA